MLKSLYIRDYAIVDEVQVEFTGGLNILTGETGAGKSILIDALGLLLGDRASSESVRQGAQKAVVEGVFTVHDNDRAHMVLLEHGYEHEADVIIRREITAKGNSRAFINDSPAPLALIREVGDQMVDLHGQHEHQLLLRADTHILLLDNAGGLDQLVRDFTAAYNDLLETRRLLDELRQREAQLRDKLEFYRYQLREIDLVDPKPDEDSTIGQELKVLENSERVTELTSSLHSLLYDDENSVRDQLLRARNALDQLISIDGAFAEYRSECMSAAAIVDEIAKYLQSYTARIDFSQERLDAMRDRLSKLNALRRKFGGTLEAVIAYREKILHEVELAENFDERIGRIERELETKRELAGNLAARLSQKRREVAKKSSRSIENVLKQLGIEKGRFTVLIDQQETSPDAPHAVRYDGKFYAARPTGFDIVEFYMTTNVGEEPKPLAKVASGGEVSRVMLALKTILAKNDKLPLLVFDEIDTGISGRIASKVGAAMKNLADFHQIIAITHLPQIAAMATTHFVVEKIVSVGRTVTRARRLNAEEHTKEVAKLMSGEELTESSLKMARELIES